MPTLQESCKVVIDYSDSKKKKGTNHNDTTNTTQRPQRLVVPVVSLWFIFLISG